MTAIIDGSLLNYIANEIFMPMNMRSDNAIPAKLGRHILVNYKLIVIFWYHNEASSLDSNLNVNIEERADNLAKACGLAVTVSEPRSKHLVIEVEILP